MTTPLYELHRAQGATFTEYQGWTVPDVFSHPTEEYWSVRRGVGVVDVSYRTTIRIGGPERIQFLHRILSNDVQNLSPGRGCRATLLTAKGKVIAAMNVFIAGEAVFLETEPAAGHPLLEKLEMYRLMQKVEIEDVTGTVAKLLVQGPRSGELLLAVCDEELMFDRELDHREVRMKLDGEEGHHESHSVSMRLIRVSETGEQGYELVVPTAEAGSVWERIMQLGASLDLKPVGFRALNILRLEVGIPWYGIDVDETHFPQEARLDEALDWNKGCFIGYEPVARIKFRGHVNRALTGLKLGRKAELESGSVIWKGDRQIGYVTSAGYSPVLDAVIALGYVRREFLDPGQEVLVQTVEGPIPAVVSRLPFIRSEPVSDNI